MSRKKDRSPGNRSIFVTILFPLFLLLLVEVLLCLVCLSLTGLFSHLNENALDILDKQTENRRGYLETSMVRDWSSLSLLSESVTAATQSMLDEGEVTLSDLEKSSDACAPLLLSVMDDLTSTLYSKRVNGVYIVLNTQDLSTAHATGYPSARSGIYIRDLDPTAYPSARNADLLLERAPIAVVRALNISTSSGWQPQFSFGAQLETYYDFIYQPFQAAYAADSVSDPADYGYWSASPYTLYGSNLPPSLSYSQPLVLKDGTVYGVMGIELLSSYLQTMLPQGELSDSGRGAYLLAVAQRNAAGDLICTPVVCSGVESADATLTLSGDQKSGYTFQLDGTEYTASVERLTLYNANAPFDNQQWVLIGTVPTGTLYAFSRQVRIMLFLVLFGTLISGTVGTVLVGRRLSKPIRRLSQEVDEAQRDRNGIPQLSATGIRELDRFSSAITALSRDVVNTSTRLLSIMEMASVELAGFELRVGKDHVYVTDNFFPLLGMTCDDPAHLTLEQFRALMEQLNSSVDRSDISAHSMVYRLDGPDGEARYVQIKITHEDGRTVGLAEDVTPATLERLRIEHERDYDLLTGLLNRRAFYRQADELFAAPEQLGHAALVMLDLDNLKSINDRFGHDWGDQYIRQAGRSFLNGIPADALCARVSGDEFFLFFYGYPDQDSIRDALRQFTLSIRDCVFVMPSGERSQVRVSGGVAWYPEDSTHFGELMKYADFAMYQVKQGQKGSLGDFDLGVYNKESHRLQCRREFYSMVQNELLTYHFQPIVNATDGSVRAYEALMRVEELPTLHSPATVLAVATELGRLNDVERLTWYKASQCYQALLDQKMVEPDALLFVNSIASQCMTHEECIELMERYPMLPERYVIEITETADLDVEATRAKRNYPPRFALDDYGSGYNSEKNLLALSPHFIKVDISITRDIDTDPDKQSIVANIVSYAHQRDMAIIAEGLETAAEVRKVLELGVDLLQGFYLARPAAIPTPIDPAALEVIRQFWAEQNKALS